MTPTGHPPPRNVVILGSTGSIGCSALSVIEHDGGRRLRAFGLTAHENVERLAKQARAFRPRFVALTHPEAVASLDGQLRGTGVEVLRGPDAVERMVTHPETERVLTAIVGAAGLKGTWAAI